MRPSSVPRTVAADPRRPVRRALARLCLALALTTLLIAQRNSFTVPGDGDRRDAIGSTAGLKPEERAAFRADPKAFTPIQKPGPSDWLSCETLRIDTLPCFGLRLVTQSKRSTTHWRLTNGPGPTDRIGLLANQKQPAALPRSSLPTELF